MDVTEQASSGHVALSGEFDIKAAAAVRAAVDRQVTRDVNITLDVGGVTFMDSSGLTMLQQVSRDARDEGWSFEISGARRSAEVERITSLARAWGDLKLSGD